MPNDERSRGKLEQELAQRTTEARILTQVSSELNSTLDPQEIFDIVLRTMDELFGFRHSMILLADESENTLTLVASRGYDGVGHGATVEIGVGVIGLVAQKRRLMRLGNLRQQRAYGAAVRKRMETVGRGDELEEPAELPGLPEAESQIVIPLVIKDTLVGVFAVESAEQASFDESDETLVTIVANQSASAINNARLFRAEREQRQKLTEAHESLAKLNKALEEAAEHRRRIAQELLRDARRRLAAPLLGDSPAVQRLRDEIKACAATDEPVMLVGPVGSGQEAIARAIHDASERRDGALIYVNCKTSASDTQELFRTVREDNAPGSMSQEDKIALAAGGTLYLDGVNELPMATQNRLGQVLADADPSREAGRSTIARVIASASRDLDEELREHRIAPLLHQMLMERQLTVPRLSERREDIPVLADYFIKQTAWRMGKTVDRVSDESMERLRSYRWPANINELRNVIERVVGSAQSPILEVDEALLDARVPVGRYHLVERINAGGMGEVWLARHQLLARPAVIKLIRPQILSDHENRQTAIKRFEREAKAVANLRSPHTIELYDFGVAEDGSLHYIMEHLEGLDLQQMVRRFGPLPAERVIALLRQACRSLIEAHAAGLVHRDVKPANLFVCKLGIEYDFLKILDFGIVKLGAGSEETMLTAANILAGTPAYLAPELIRGDVKVDGRADVYCLGCVAYWMLTGSLVFPAETAMDMAIKHATKTPEPPSKISELAVPEDLERIIMACLGKSPDDRPDASDLWRGLGQIELGETWTPDRAEQWWRLHVPELAGDGS